MSLFLRQAAEELQISLLVEMEKAQSMLGETNQ